MTNHVEDWGVRVYRLEPKRSPLGEMVKRNLDRRIYEAVSVKEAIANDSKIIQEIENHANKDSK